MALIKFSELSEDNFLNIFNKKPGGILIILSKNLKLENETAIWTRFSKITGN